jgi:hypothetical protein
MLNITIALLALAGGFEAEVTQLVRFLGQITPTQLAP